MRKLILLSFVTLLTTMSFALFATAGPPDVTTTDSKSIGVSTTNDAQQVTTAGDITITPAASESCVSSIEVFFASDDPECLQNDQAISSTTAALTTSPPEVQEQATIPNAVPTTDSNEVTLSGIWLYEVVGAFFAASAADSPNTSVSYEVTLSGIWLDTTSLVAHTTNPPANLTSAVRSEKNGEVVEPHIISPISAGIVSGSGAAKFDTEKTS